MGNQIIISVIISVKFIYLNSWESMEELTFLSRNYFLDVAGGNSVSEYSSRTGF